MDYLLMTNKLATDKSANLVSIDKVFNIVIKTYLTFVFYFKIKLEINILIVFYLEIQALFSFRTLSS